MMAKSPFSLMFLVILAVQLTACSSVQKFIPTIEAPRPTQPILRRGWAFLEAQEWRRKRISDSRPINFASPILADKRIFFGTVDFGVYAIDQVSGRKVWQKQIEGGVSAEPTYSDGVLFIGNIRGDVVAIDVQTGSNNWSVNLEIPVIGKPFFLNGRLFVATEDEKIHALDSSTGKKLWTYSRRPAASTTIKGGGRISYFAGRLWVGFSDGTLVALEPNDGSVQFERQYIDNQKFTDIDARPVPWRNGLFIATYDGKLRYLRKEGQTVWEFPVGSARAPLFVSERGGLLYYAGSDGFLYCLAATNGKEIWRQEMKSGLATGMRYLESSGTLVVSSSDKYVYAFDGVSGKKLDQYSLGGGSGSYGAMVASKNEVYLVSNRGRLYQFKVNR